jgi:hypothetical protein
MLAPVRIDTRGITPGYFNDEASTVTVELDRNEINSPFPSSSKMGQGAFEASLTKCRDKVRIERGVHFLSTHCPSASEGLWNLRS